MVGDVAAVVLGGVFAVSGVAKLSSPDAWRTQSIQLDVPPIAAAIVPYVEVGLAGLLIAGVFRQPTAVVGVCLLVAFTAFLIVRIRQGRRPACACFGSLRSRPIGWGHVARNAVFIAVGIVAATVGQ